MTLAEKILWAELRKLGANVRRQAPIGRYVADFVCHGPRVVIEVDGVLHDLSESGLHDAERTAWLEAQGYRVLRFRNAEIVDDLDRVAREIAVALKVAPLEASDRTSRLTPPSPTLPPSRGKGERS